MLIDTDMRILVADDFSTMRSVVVKILSELGFTHIDEAADGEQAWFMIQAQAKNQAYDLILSDCNMPGMTGLELLYKIKSTAGMEKTRFVLITAEAKAVQIKEACALGADGYILKPFSAEKLYQKIFEIYSQLDNNQTTNTTTANLTE